MAERMSLSLELIGKSSSLRQELNTSRSAISRFASSARRELSAVGQAARSLTGQIMAVGGAFTALKLLADSAGLDKNLTRTKQTAQATAREMAILRKELFSMARKTGQPLEGLQQGFDGLVQSGLKWQQALETIKAINVGSGVSGVNPETLGKAMTVGAAAFDFDLSKPGLALELLDKMTVAGRQGISELGQLADIFSRVGVNAKSAGMGFEQTLAFVEAMSYVEAQPERLATLVDSTLRLFNNVKYMRSAQKATGVRFFDAKGNRRDAMAIIGDMRKQYKLLDTDKKRALFIDRAFGHADLDTQKGMKIFLEGDSVDNVTDFTKKISDAGGTLNKELDEATSNMIDQMGMLKADLREAADGFVKPMNETLVNWIKFARKPTEEGGMGMDGKKIIGGGLALGATAIAVRQGVKRLLTSGGGLAVGVGVGKALEEFAGVTPVFVVNMPGGGITGGGSSPLLPGPGGSAPRLPGPASPKMFPAVSGPLIGMTAAGAIYLFMAGSHDATIQNMQKATDKDLYATRNHQMVTGGAGGSWEVRAIDEELLRRSWESKTENKINLNINIDKLGRVTTSSPDPNTRSTINLKRGSFEEALANEQR